MGYRGLQVITRGDRGLLEVYKGLQEVRGSNRRLQVVTRDLKG